MTTEFPKINGVFKRYTEGPNKGRFIVGDFSQPEYEYLLDNEWTWTEKVDGTNIRLHFDGTPEFRGNEHAYVAGRTDNAQLHKDLTVALVDLLRHAPLEDVFPDVSPEAQVVLYGEGYGAGIQKGGGKYREDKNFVLFDVRVGRWWLNREDVEDVASQLGLDVVPVVWRKSLWEAINSMSGRPFVSGWENQDAPEGVVGRPSVQLFDRRGNRITTKLKYVDF